MPNYPDTELYIVQTADPTRQMRFDLSGLATPDTVLTIALPGTFSVNTTMALWGTENTFTNEQHMSDSALGDACLRLDMADVAGGNAAFMVASDATDGTVWTFSFANGTGGAIAYTLPAVSGTVALLEANNVWTGSNVLNGANTTFNGPVHIADSHLRFVDSGSGFNTYLHGANPPTNDRDQYMQDANGTIALVETTTSVSASSDLPGQTANIGSTTLLTAPAAGQYRITAYLETTGIGVGTNIVTFAWSDDVGATTDASTVLALTGTGRVAKVIPAYIASGNLTFSSSGYTSGTFTLHVRVERI